MILEITCRGIANAQGIFDAFAGEGVSMHELSTGHYVLTVSHAKGTFEQNKGLIEALRIPSAHVKLLSE